MSSESEAIILDINSFGLHKDDGSSLQADELFDPLSLDSFYFRRAERDYFPRLADETRLGSGATFLNREIIDIILLAIEEFGEL